MTFYERERDKNLPARGEKSDSSKKSFELKMVE